MEREEESGQNRLRLCSLVCAVRDQTWGCFSSVPASSGQRAVQAHPDELSWTGFIGVCRDGPACGTS